MNASAARSPLSTSGPATVRPSPFTTFTTPRGNASAKAFSRGAWQSIPYRGSFATTVLPMIRAGTSVVNVSFSG